MSGQKQSFRFRLPWLPSLVSAPGRSSLTQRSRKTATDTPQPVDLVGVNMIPIQRDIEEVESESVARANRSLAQPDSQTALRIRDLEPHKPPQLNQQQLKEASGISKRTDSQSPFGKVEAAVRDEPAEFHIHLSGTDSTPSQLSNTSSAPVQTTQDQATKSQEAESQHFREAELPSPPATKTPPQPPARESKVLSPSKGAKLIQQKSNSSKSSSSSSSSPQKASQPRPKSKQHLPSHTGTSTRANPRTSPDAGNHTRSFAKQPSPDADIHTRSSAKQPSPYAGIHSQSSAKQPSPSREAVTRTTLFQTVPSHTVKSANILSTSSSSSSSSSPSSSSPSSSPPSSTSSQSSTSSYLIGESSNSSSKQLTSSPTPKSSPTAKNSKLKTHTSQDYRHNSTLPQEESNQPYATNSTDLEAVQANEANTPITVYDKMVPESSHTRFMEHPSTEEASETDEDKSKSARNKRKRKLFPKRVSPHENILMPHNSHKGDRHSKIPLHKDIRSDVSNFTEKLSLGKLGQSRSEDRPVSIITISGDNKGATFHLNGKGPTHITIANSDSAGTKGEDPHKKYEQQKRMSCVNSNIQSINNSMLLNSSVQERNPGVHFGTQGKSTKSAPSESKRKELSSSSDNVSEMSFNVTTARKIEYNKPVIKRRCLRGLLMESSESEADNPDKPRRHGCRVACGNKGKYDF